MKLFLTSDTITKNLVGPFEKLIGKRINGLKVAFIPDAAFGVNPKKDISWVEEERDFLIENYKWDITDFVLKDVQNVVFTSFVKYDVLFVNGGFSGYLAKEMRKVGFDKILPKLLEKGIVYVGSSAGSMVTSDVQDASSWYIGEPEPDAINIPGLGFVDFQIYPHFKLGLKNQIIEKRNKKLDYYLLPDGTAISIDGENISFLGEGIIH